MKKAICGLEESPLLWSKERDKKLAKMTIEIPTKEDPTVKEESILKKLRSDPNTWHILKKGEEEESKGFLLTYVDDILVATAAEIGEATMKAIDQTWKCSPEEVALEEGKRCKFLWKSHCEDAERLFHSSEALHKGIVEKAQTRRMQFHKDDF